MPRWSRLLVAVTATVLTGASLAQTPAPYPTRPVRVIVPFGAGGPGDVFARLIAQKLGEGLGQTFYVENHAGAGGTIGTGIAARAAPDGYTLLVVSSTHMINATLYPHLPYDSLASFAPVTIAATTPNVLIVHPSVPATTVKELVALIRAHKYDNYAMGGIGTPSHISGEIFRQSLDLDLTAIPFPGGGPMIASVVGGHTPIAFSALAPVAAAIKQGQLRALAVTSATRSPVLPDVPTLAEAGFADQENDTPQGILAPIGTPRPIIDLLNGAIAKAMAAPDVKQKMLAIGFEPVATTPEAFAERIRTDIPRLAKIIRAANIKPE
jgi:tripartite-type tricarboxylate transporter receptor subunit TctC